MNSIDFPARRRIALDASLEALNDLRALRQPRRVTFGIPRHIQPFGLVYPAAFDLNKAPRAKACRRWNRLQRIIRRLDERIAAAGEFPIAD